jgi:hypothetical protein
MARLTFGNFESFLRYVKSFKKPERVRLFIVEDNSGTVILKRAVEGDSIDTAVITGLSGQQLSTLIKEYGYDSNIFRIERFSWEVDR